MNLYLLTYPFTPVGIVRQAQSNRSHAPEGVKVFGLPAGYNMSFNPPLGDSEASCFVAIANEITVSW